MADETTECEAFAEDAKSLSAEWTRLKAESRQLATAKSLRRLREFDKDFTEFGKHLRGRVDYWVQNGMMKQVMKQENDEAEGRAKPLSRERRAEVESNKCAKPMSREKRAEVESAKRVKRDHDPLASKRTY